MIFTLGYLLRVLLSLCSKNWQLLLGFWEKKKGFRIHLGIFWTKNGRLVSSQQSRHQTSINECFSRLNVGNCFPCNAKQRTRWIDTSNWMKTSFTNGKWVLHLFTYDRLDGVVLLREKHIANARRFSWSFVLILEFKYRFPWWCMHTYVLAEHEVNANNYVNKIECGVNGWAPSAKGECAVKMWII